MGGPRIGAYQSAAGEAEFNRTPLPDFGDKRPKLAGPPSKCMAVPRPEWDGRKGRARSQSEGRGLGSDFSDGRGPPPKPSHRRPLLELEPWGDKRG